MEGTICDIFHRDDSGWRKCIICDKKLHCGCIMSAHTFTELDSGGVKCIECISNEESMGPINWNAPHQTLEDLQEPPEVLCVDSQTIIVNYESTQGEPSKGAHFENPGVSKEPQGDAPRIYRRHVLVPSEEELSQIKRDMSLTILSSNSVVVPLFAKVLSKSDANSKNARLVVPRKCAQAFLPKLSEPKGFPITIQDPSGKEWKLHYRFWPNKSTIYVLEGMRRYYEFHQCKPGDEVAFYRIDPEGKLVLGVKKSPATSGQKGL
ncbi:hypothetical protein Dsin_022639 [Dipteronia sinensis]|uniref:TF-B3 domain-containing protein n=1 Tax=Dipteronia sinensis TaxID=43782 RepID=A0AAE0E093_9ROSI|nr:hypothetical protein Dsin_022639 [Dipteronia sinensis]